MSYGAIDVIMSRIIQEVVHFHGTHVQFLEVISVVLKLIKR